MESVKDAISWFEIPVTDFARAKSFYQTIFDFEMAEMEMPPFTMGIFLHDQENGGIGGAICYEEGYKPSGGDGPKAYLNIQLTPRPLTASPQRNQYLHCRGFQNECLHRVLQLFSCKWQVRARSRRFLS